jgi:hypothetical protein
MITRANRRKRAGPQGVGEMRQAFQANAALPTHVADMLSRSLGQAVAQCWSHLPQEAQHDLFEAAVAAEGEALRQQLAIFLHGHHARTLDALHARAIQEPDSLGG